MGCDAVQQMAIEVKLIDEAVSCARHIVFFVRVLLREGHEQFAVKHLHVERREAGWHERVGEALDLIKLVVENLNLPVREIGCEQASVVRMRASEIRLPVVEIACGCSRAMHEM